MTDYRTLVTSEHQKPNFLALIDAVANGIGDITALIQTIPDLYDIDNAVGDQLDTVGQWVGQSRVVPDVLNLAYFGFSELGGGTDGDQAPFGELGQPSIGAPFYDLGDPVGTTTSLNDAQYRTILRAVIVRNQYDGTLGQFEQALEDIFGCACAVIDTGIKSITINVAQPPSQVIQSLVATFDILPRPAGVKIASITYGSPIQTESGVDITTEGGQVIDE